MGRMVTLLIIDNNCIKCFFPTHNKCENIIIKSNKVTKMEKKMLSIRYNKIIKIQKLNDKKVINYLSLYLN